MNGANHTVTSAAHLEVTPADLELARRGFPSRSVSAADIAAAYGMQPGESRTFEPGDPGYRLEQAEYRSPEYPAQFEAYISECEDEAAWSRAQAERQAEAGQ